MTLKQKREIVGKFKAGSGILDLAAIARGKRKYSIDFIWDDAADEALQVLRDYMNGKFQLARKK